MDALREAKLWLDKLDNAETDESEWNYLRYAEVNAAVAQAEAAERIAVALERLAIVVDGAYGAVRVSALRQG